MYLILIKRSALQQQLGRSPSQQQQQNQHQQNIMSQSPYGSSRYNQQQQNMVGFMRSPSNQLTQASLRNPYQQPAQQNSEVSISIFDFYKMN